MRVLPLLLVCLLFGCSSSGTESGNPTRGACEGVRCVCSSTVTLHVTDASSGAPIGMAITVDGQSFECTETSTTSVCVVSEASFATKGMHDIVVSAPNHDAKTITIDVPADAECCFCPSSSVVVDVAIEPSP